MRSPWLVVLFLGCGPTVATDSASSGTGDDGGTTVQPSTTDVTASSTSPASSSTTATVTTANPTTNESSDDSVGDGIFDVMPATDLGPSCVARDPGSRIAGLVWLADNNLGTLSKIDAASLGELARYDAGPDAPATFSSVSVGRNGDVVVTQTNSGVAMLRADVDDCGNRGTSSGADDVVPWPDGCVAWHDAFADQTRAVAWTGGELDLDTCRYIDTKVWTAGKQGTTTSVRLLDGETGALEQSVDVPGLIPGGGGLWTAAVDSQDGLWAHEFGTGLLVHVDRDTLEVDTWDLDDGGYGLAIDRHGRVWTCGQVVVRFDPATETWDSAAIGGLEGCAPGPDDVLWVTGTSLFGVDIDSLDVVVEHGLPELAYGVGLDFDGYLWVSSSFSDVVFRVDPIDGTSDTIGGFASITVHGDVAGTALALAHGQL